ncbi:MAG: ribulose-phosphate 3-epimerase [Acutalibacter sp.]|jgi:ribulose-phosphate 3-epimerase|nr:ribulose-phosphate 3-epimerase [Acutalibacter sp.]
MVYIAPSLLAADFSALDREVAKIKQADMLHIDIMDGHFVPNISFGPGVVAALRDKTRLLFDVHLMLEHPMPYIAPFRKAGADVITFHVECKDDPEELIAAIRSSGAQAGAAVSPGTPASAIGDWGRRLRQVTVMTVNPGFGGQKLMLDPLRKIFQLKYRFPRLLVEVDGGVNLETAPLCKAAGADILVAGTSVFQAEDPYLEMRCLAL